ncbi:MAG: DNA-binding protein YbiB [Burkholderiaceae bacterium]|nr:MAG: DNA-binding protein YbiB [Burkholderiaceae bacterium]
MTSTFSCAPYIKEIGRGKAGARSLSHAQAFALFDAILRGQVSDLELGAVMLAFRVKGESVEEMTAYMDAAQTWLLPLHVDSAWAPVVLPSYNGARHAPNLLPLLAALLARAGVPVLVHGIEHFSGRVSSFEIWEQLGWPVADADSGAEAQAQMQTAWAQQQPVFVPTRVLAPRLAELIHLRTILGVRNATHTLIKMVQPFTRPALRIVSYTHPEYHQLQTEVLRNSGAHALLLRGTEGEVVANPRRQPQIEWFHGGQLEVVQPVDMAPLVEVPPLPASRDAEPTAQWIAQALDGQQPVPAVITQQVEQTLRALKYVQPPI